MFINIYIYIYIKFVDNLKRMIYKRYYRIKIVILLLLRVLLRWPQSMSLHMIVI